ncbi:MAG: hypothetical protein A3F82_10080 [Deltaproteobacteria bacterium RIFCSPLOWO2_12_FULL_44_12]|nr:MAG: hypothetical protein A2712_00250 [Deltaproteobacteria bacterium RIFCSPHIGHO2_01_FULL_43_49]OGQ15848.1 MAG: hypothetical protein A3D22_02900 [Deltaproteobacteria bacterium RIFCSPHIGHO2_02_FULL_44_53]OGQ28802.1 MAG: hypothetical protein A3D98_01230 [Deltaproteobacteria bacterium RIFCSPHIGHO2_12_FULL_44_21]OGQ32122.1 MAG: hypothetical protein A2979_03355 [Deltaproteobacteria bacterium RIFCSPLOWO2_01_FULL_45_74]OGQ43735.1 MAG: hypothetical protein A3I70_05635 [Deltaproteobacteria bacterium 
MATLLEVKNLVKHYRSGKSRVHAVNGVSLELTKGEVLGVVGESGCGKTTLGLLITRLVKSDSGDIVFEGNDITHLSQRTLRPLRAKIQMIFQDPYASLNPRMRAGEIIEEPLIIHKRGNTHQRHDQVMELLDLVGLSPNDYNKYPHEFSGGQRQRIGIARAIALKPDLIIADEPVSALDVSIQGEIINLLKNLQKKFNLTYIFISHDLKVVSQISDRIAVMYLGKIVELFPAEKLSFARHPYTQALLTSVPLPDPKRKKEYKPLGGDVPSPVQLPTGCLFHPRCPYREEVCVNVEPQLESHGPNDLASCHLTHKVPKEIPI